MLKFKRTMDCGDATANYDVEFTPGGTFADFMKDVLKQGEWGSIKLLGIAETWPPFIEYRGEHFTVRDQELFHKYQSVGVKSVQANGGWGLMSYDVTLEETAGKNREE